jgi:hypothetical protein
VYDIKKYVRPTFAPDKIGEYMFVVDLFNDKKTRTAEIPSGNMHANARALAKVANCLLVPNEEPSTTTAPSSPFKRLLSIETIVNACSHATSNFDNLMKSHTVFTRGGWSVFSGGVGYDRQGSLGKLMKCILLYHAHLNLVSVCQVGLVWEEALVSGIMRRRLRLDILVVYSDLTCGTRIPAWFRMLLLIALVS